MHPLQAIDYMRKIPGQTRYAELARQPLRLRAWVNLCVQNIFNGAPSTLNRNKGIQAAAKKTSLGVL
jgi:hypothetical protein